MGLMLLTAAGCGWKLMSLSAPAGPRLVCHACGRAIESANENRCPNCLAIVPTSDSQPSRVAELDEPNRHHADRRTTAKSALQAMARGDRLLYFKGLQPQQPATPSCHNPLCTGSTETTTGNDQRFCSRCGTPFEEATTNLQVELSNVRTKRTELRRYLEVVATADPASADRSLKSAQATARTLFDCKDQSK